MPAAFIPNGNAATECRLCGDRFGPPPYGVGRSETDCPLGTGHSSEFNSGDLADVRQLVITTLCGHPRKTGIGRRNRCFWFERRRKGGCVKVRC